MKAYVKYLWARRGELTTHIGIVLIVVAAFVHTLWPNSPYSNMADTALALAAGLGISTPGGPTIGHINCAVTSVLHLWQVRNAGALADAVTQNAQLVKDMENKNA